MPQPIIGITMSLDNYGKIRPGTDYSFIRTEYGKQVKKSGGQPVFLDPHIDPMVAARLCDGVIISGGGDINPVLYNESVSTGDSDLEPLLRTEWERELIDACDWANTPILGVCYGSQLLNVHYGGTLYQDISIERQNSLFHGHSGKAEIHPVTFISDFLSFIPGESTQTAHRHHQAIRDIAPGFSAVAYAPDGTIEAISGHGHYGIQWHAESDGTADRIYANFIQSCKLSSSPHVISDMLPEPSSETI